MNLSMYARARPVAYWSQLLKFFPVKLIYVYLKKIINQWDKQTELHVRTDLKHIQLFLSHPCFVRKSSVDSKGKGAILLSHIGIHSLWTRELYLLLNWASHTCWEKFSSEGVFWNSSFLGTEPFISEKDRASSLYLLTRQRNQCCYC